MHFIPVVCCLDYNVLNDPVADLFSCECCDKAGAQETSLEKFGTWIKMNFKMKNLNQTRTSNPRKEKSHGQSGWTVFAANFFKRGSGADITVAMVTSELLVCVRAMCVFSILLLQFQSKIKVAKNSVFSSSSSKENTYPILLRGQWFFFIYVKTWWDYVITFGSKFTDKCTPIVLHIRKQDYLHPI